MSMFIDRRPNSRHKGAVNRRRFIQRFQGKIQKAVSNSVNNRNITDIEQGDSINLPTKDIQEPEFSLGVGGKKTMVLPGNRDFAKGDRIKRPKSAAEHGSGDASNEPGESGDDFVFKISREEFLDMFFDDLELPNLLKKKLAQTKSQQLSRAGYTSTGTPTNINIIRSFKGAIGRRLAATNKDKKRLVELELQLQNLQDTQPVDEKQKLELEQQIKYVKKKIARVPFLDPFDLKYNSKIVQTKPATKAVMFCIMDVSGSMDEVKKDIAKRFFILLYLFLKRTYEQIEIVFIRHHTAAKEVNEQDFFYSKETGGTVVSSALELMQEIIDKRYSPEEWNIFGAQASDGDNWNNDSPKCSQILKEGIMPYVQYFSYIEIMPRHHQSLWEAYQQVQAVHEYFSMQHISSSAEIYQVFRELFKRQQCA